MGNIPERSSKGLRYRQTILTGGKPSRRENTYVLFLVERSSSSAKSNQFSSPLFFGGGKIYEAVVQRRFGAKKMAAASTEGFPDFSFFCTGNEWIWNFSNTMPLPPTWKKWLKKGGKASDFFCVVLFEGMTSMLLLSEKERAERERVKKRSASIPPFPQKSVLLINTSFQRGFTPHPFLFFLWVTREDEETA